MTINELERLAQLHRDGALSDDEFTRAKALLLDDTQPLSTAAVEKIEHIAHHQALLRLDHDWNIERENYLITNGQTYRRVVPTKAGAYGVFGIVGIMLAVIIYASVSTYGSHHVFSKYLPVLIVVMLVITGVGIHIYSKAEAYQKAEQHYLQRRQAILLEMHPSDDGPAPQR